MEKRDIFRNLKEKVTSFQKNSKPPFQNISNPTVYSNPHPRLLDSWEISNPLVYSNPRLFGSTLVFQPKPL